MADYKEVSRDKIVILDNNENRLEEKGGDIIESVGKVGIRVPLIVYINPEDPETYVLVAGHRRLKSAEHFNIKTIPVQIIDQKDCTEVRAIENMDRKALHPLDESEQIRRLQQKNWSNSEIAGVLGLSIARVRKRALLYNLIDEAKNKLRKNAIKLEVAEEIAIHDSDTQKMLIKKVSPVSTAEETRRIYIASQGFGLDGVVDEVINAEPSCHNCPKNAAEDAELFPGTNGSCKDIDCFCNKIRARMKELNIKNVVTYWDCPKEIKENLSKDFNVETSFYSYRDEQTNEDDIQGMMLSGKVVYQQRRDEKKIKEVKSQKDILFDKYRDTVHEGDKLIFPYMKECARAYMDKNHKNESFPDSSELVLLAEKILDTSRWDMSRFLGADGDFNEVLAESNKMKVGYALMYIHAEAIQTKETRRVTFFCPTAPTSAGDVELPLQFDLTDCLSLKTSKVKKKAEEVLESLRNLKTEYEGT